MDSATQHNTTKIDPSDQQNVTAGKIYVKEVVVIDFCIITLHLVKTLLLLYFTYSTSSVG